MEDLLTSPLFVGLIVGLPTSIFGYIAYRRTEKLDQTAAITAEIALAIDKRDVQDKITDLRAQLAECRTAYAELKRTTGTT